MWTRLSAPVAGILVSLAAEVGAGVVALREKPGHVSEAVAVVDAPPAEVYRFVTDYARWPAILSDVTSATVERGGRGDARVRFHSRALGLTATILFDNIPDRLIRFRGVEGPPGGRAGGSYLLEPVDGGRRTRVTSDLYLDVVGVPGWFITDARIRKMRRTKLEHDLTDVQRHFASAGSPVVTAP